MALKPLKNPQDELINSIDGIYLVDAGAGTGKTYSIVKRYEKIVSSSVKPEEILLITFTKNAADQMKEKVISKLSSEISVTKLLEAPIMTFHAFCSRILKKSGSDAPSYLGISEYISPDFNLIENPSVESEVFRKFYLNFSNANREKFGDLFYILDDHDLILTIIKKLCSLGVFPHAEGWSEDDLNTLKGNYDEFCEKFDKQNLTVIGKSGKPVNNKLHKKFCSAVKDKLYTDYDKEIIFSEKSIDPGIREELFIDEGQEEYIEFIRVVYLSYIEYLLKRNMINFDFIVMFAYISLMNKPSVRNNNRFDYIMIDEFQDTDEIQFRLIMLICNKMSGTANLCVVGDWKQSIYGFRNSKIENITSFAENLKYFKDELNKDTERVDYDVNKFKKIIFENNYRSSGSILNFSKFTLRISATADEEVDTENIDTNFKDALKPQRDLQDLSEIKFYKAADRKDEYRLILSKISELVNEKDKYRIREFDGRTGEVTDERPVRYSDICILSRTKKFCLELYREGKKSGIPVNYKGGLELFASEQGILTLAWLKLLINDKDIFGWLPVLEKEGYTFNEIKHLRNKILEANPGEKNLSFMPEDLDKFLKRIRKYRSNILFAVDEILSRYKYNDDTGNKIITVIKKRIESELISLNELVQIIDSSIDMEYDIELGNTTDAVLTQTIHSSKGLEYPVVILANINSRVFPGFKSDKGTLTFNTIAGLRGKKFFGKKNGIYFKFNNWKTDLVNATVKKTDYDEDRRLLYVAVTRTKQYLYMTSGNPSALFSNLALESGKDIIEDFSYEIKSLKEEKSVETPKIKLEQKINKSKKFISPHSLMYESDEHKNTNYNSDTENSFTVSAKNRYAFGLKIHTAAHRIANGMKAEKDIPETERISKFISGLNADELKSEVDFLMPDIESGNIIRGTIDLIAFYKDRIEIFDYKTDKNKNNLEKYKMQLSVYKKALKEIYKDKKLIAKIFFVSLDEIEEVA